MEHICRLQSLKVTRLLRRCFIILNTNNKNIDIDTDKYLLETLSPEKAFFLIL